MASEHILHPAPGCIVEMLQGNEIQTACVLENGNGRLRIITANRREANIPEARLLPWSGPQLSAPASKDAAVTLISSHAARRDELAKRLDPMAWWELAQGEMTSAGAEWFAGLTDETADADLTAACGHVLLASKTHFKFQPPTFEILDAETVEKRIQAKDREAARERTAKQGLALMHALWDAFLRQSPPPSERSLAALDAETLEELKAVLLRQITASGQQDDPIWRTVSKGLPDDPYLPLHLAQAWGLVGPHHDIWLYQADYDAGNDWSVPFKDDLDTLSETMEAMPLPLCELPFISIDNASTRDIDDAFHIVPTSSGWRLTLALACPACAWPLGSGLDLAVRHRATSIYLPEGTYHMLPESLATDGMSLLADTPRPALLVGLDIAYDGTLLACTPSMARVRLAANLNYADAEAAIDGADTPAAPYADRLREALAMAEARQARRLADGAVIISRPEIVLTLDGDAADKDIRVDLTVEEDVPRAHLVVAEQMIAANHALAAWAHTAGIPLLFRGQDLRTTENLSGIWTDPVRMVAVVKQMAPAVFDTIPRRHAGIGAPMYASVTSPLRRYADLFNEIQIVRTLTGRSPLDKTAADHVLNALSPRIDATGQLQRMRTRYWKLVHLRQNNDRRWPALVTDCNGAYVTATLLREQVLIRGRAAQFPADVRLGMPVTVRLGRIDPWTGDIMLADVQPVALEEPQ